MHSTDVQTNAKFYTNRVASTSITIQQLALVALYTLSVALVNVSISHCQAQGAVVQWLSSLVAVVRSEFDTHSMLRFAWQVIVSSPGPTPCYVRGIGYYHSYTKSRGGDLRVIVPSDASQLHMRYSVVTIHHLVSRIQSQQSASCMTSYPTINVGQNEFAKN